MENNFPGFDQTKVSYVANYLFESDTDRSHFLLSPAEWDSEDTDDETINNKERKYLNNKEATS